MDFRDAPVKDIMTKSVVGIPAEASIKEAASVMHNTRIHGAIVYDRNAKPLGVVSDTDFCRSVKEEISPLESIRKIMTPTIIAIDPEATIMEATKLLIKSKITRLFVVEGVMGKTDLKKMPDGIISSSDIVNKLYRSNK